MLADVKRYFALLLIFCAVDILGGIIGTHHTPYSFDKISLTAALLTILWAIRDGQEAKQ